MIRSKQPALYFYLQKGNILSVKTASIVISMRITNRKIHPIMQIFQQSFFQKNLNYMFLSLHTNTTI